MLKDSSAEQLKIIDFGTAQDLSVTPTPKVMVGTPEFIGERHSIHPTRYINKVFPFSNHSGMLSSFLCLHFNAPFIVSYA